MNIIPPVVSGLGDGVLLFLIASGLSLIFGAMRFLNFAHGAFFAVGAYVVFVVVGASVPGVPLLLGAAILAGVVVAVLSFVSEKVVFRQLYRMAPIDSLLGTYALLLLLEGALLLTWGPNPLSIPYPESLTDLVQIGSVQFPQYSGLLILVGILVVVVMTLILYKTSFGLQTRALAEDRLVTQLLGVSTGSVSTKVMLLGGFLAGIGGALAAPTLALTPDLAVVFIIQAFAVVVVGGLGSFYGSLVAALVLSVVQSLTVTYFPQAAGIGFYVAMFLILVFRPQGLFGRGGLEIGATEGS